KFKEQVFSDSLEFEESFIDQMYSACTKEQRPVFESIFKNYIDNKVSYKNITTYEQVCEKLNIKVLTLEDFLAVSNNNIKQAARSLAFHQITNIEKLFNGDWIVDWNNSNQPKYYPYFEYKGGRLVFVEVHCHFCRFFGEVAFYKSAEVARHVGNHFIDIYDKLNRGCIS